MAKPPAASSRLPRSLESILSDGHHGPCRTGNPYAVWTPPPYEWIARHRSELERALDALRANLAPAPAELVRDLLARLAVLKGSLERNQAEWKLISEEYLRLLGHYPADIWLSAYDEFTLSNRFFPDASELNQLMAPRLHLRKQQIARLEEMLVRESDDGEDRVYDREAIRRCSAKLADLLRSNEISQLTEEEARCAIHNAQKGKT